MFSGDDVASAYFDELREGYIQKAKEKLLTALNADGQMDYDVAWSITLRFPLVWGTDLKEWIDDWRKKGNLELRGPKSNERVLKLGQQVGLQWIPNSSPRPN